VRYSGDRGCRALARPDTAGPVHDDNRLRVMREGVPILGAERHRLGGFVVGARCFSPDHLARSSDRDVFEDLRALPGWL
jgi:hypothetical protein